MHKRTKALAIPRRVKEAVAERDSEMGRPCCVICGKPAPVYNPLAFSCCHVLRRSRGGLGVETNIVTLCPVDHEIFDSGDKGHAQIIHAHMMDHYPGWRLEDQRYKK